jgi:hypothetical protein
MSRRRAGRREVVSAISPPPPFRASGVVGRQASAWFPMNDKSVDICIPIAIVLAVVAAWQFYGLVSDDVSARHGSVQIAVSPSPPLRATDPLSD